MRVHIEWPTLTIHIYPMLTGLPPRVHARAPALILCYLGVNKGLGVYLPRLFAT